MESTGLSVQEKKRKIDFQDGGHGGHLGFPIGTILAIFDLQVTLMVPSKFGVNWPFGSGEEATRAVVGQRSSPAGYILYCNIFIIKPYNIGHTDLDVFVCKSFCHIDIIIQV